MSYFRYFFCGLILSKVRHGSYRSSTQLRHSQGFLRRFVRRFRLVVRVCTGYLRYSLTDLFSGILLFFVVQGRVRHLLSSVSGLYYYVSAVTSTGLVHSYFHRFFTM